MSLIIAGRFQTFPKAEAAAQRLFAGGFLEEDVTLFYVAPSGQHARLATGGDHDAALPLRSTIHSQSRTDCRDSDS